jgi:NAD(P)-dependent dehydrogenase (short-subunit alcohol dehydrogenase family)
MSDALTGKTALVTGGSRGIGRGIATRLAADGALVAVHYATNSQAAAETVTSIEAAGGSAFAIGQPFGDQDDAARLVERLDHELSERTGSTHLDILVNNAGVSLQGGLAETTAAIFDEQFAVNTRAPFFLTQAAAQRMGPGGRIITISSGVTRQAFPNLLAYSMSKAAIDVMARTLAKELGPRGITVNVVAAGLVDTDMNAGWLRASDEAREQAASVSAFGRVGQPSDIADVVAFTASDDARWITGQVIDATGGSVL